MSELKLLGAADLQMAYHLDRFEYYGEMFGNFDVEGLTCPYGQYDHSTFVNITFDSSDFSNASFTKAVLTNVVFTNSDLGEADFSSAELEEVSFLECDLTKVCFQSANLKNITITDCIGGPDFSDSEIEGSVFYKCVLGGADFTDAALKETVFTGCDLSRCFIAKDTSFDKVTLTQCDITELCVSIAKERRELVLFECMHRPHLKFEGAGTIKQLPSIGSTTKSERAHGWVAYGNTSAHLVCSDIEEYRAAQ